MDTSIEELNNKLLRLEPGDHMCCLYETEEEHRRLLTPYLQQGLDNDQKVIYITDARTGQQVLDYLGGEVEELTGSGRLQLAAASDSYLRDGVFDPDRMIELLDREASRALKDGYTALRVTGEMSWALRGDPGSERLIEYETKLNDFLPGKPITALCQYDRRRFGADVLRDVLRTHPIVVVGLEVYENFYFIPPSELAKNPESDAELGHWIKNLQLHKQQQERISYRSKFQRMVAGISTDFISANSENVDDKINRMLRKAGRFFGVDRSYVVLLTESGKYFAYSHEWCEDGIEAQRVRINERSVENLPWWAKETLNGRIVKVEDIDGMAQAAAEQRELRKQGVKSVLSVPIAHKEHLLGALGFDSVRRRKRWDDGDIVLLKLLANVLAEAGYRMMAEWERELLRKEIEASYSYDDIVSRSPAMQDIFAILPDISASDATVIIEGESGTGKELFARAIHNHSPRSDQPYIKVNCAAMPDTLLESELFGYKAGAFTDARKDKPGLFARADGGTIFLDEIGDMSPALQVKLLRVLQDGTYEPVGGTETVQSNARVISATNRKLEHLVREGKFRADLYFRINVMRLQLPPLRERTEDIPLLVEHIIARFNLLKGRKISGVSDEVMARFLVHEYPGNVRELENIIEHAFVLCRDAEIEVKHLPPALQSQRREDSGFAGDDGQKTLEEMERYMIEETLKRNDDNKAETARELGISKRTLFRKLKNYGADDPA